MKAENRGSIYVLISAILFSIGGLCIKMVPWNGLAINGARNIIAVVIIGCYLKKIGHKIIWNKAVAFGAFCLAMTTSLYSVANKLTTAANTIVLQFTAPVFVIILTWMFFKKKPVKQDLITCVIVFIGILFFFIDSMDKGNMLGNLLAVLSGVSYAGVFMMNSFENSDSLSSIILGQAICAVGCGGFIFKETDFSATAIIGILLLGVFQLGLAYIFMAKGLEKTNALTASLTSAIEPILNPIWVALVIGEMISPMAFVGAVIVFVTIVVYNVSKIKNQS